MREDLVDEYETTRHIVRFIENKNIIKFLDTKMLKSNQVYYEFIHDKNAVISCLYSKIVVGEYDGVLSIIGPTRVDYKKNIKIIKKIIRTLNK
ncbi:MAG: hypothetical protein GXP45_02440 [bacterium]|nr:hypothetical protein [bacterium]